VTGAAKADNEKERNHGNGDDGGNWQEKLKKLNFHA